MNCVVNDLFKIIDSRRHTLDHLQRAICCHLLLQSQWQIPQISQQGSLMPDLWLQSMFWSQVLSSMQWKGCLPSMCHMCSAQTHVEQSLKISQKSWVRSRKAFVHWHYCTSSFPLIVKSSLVRSATTELTPSFWQWNRLQWDLASLSYLGSFVMSSSETRLTRPCLRRWSNWQVDTGQYVYAVHVLPASSDLIIMYNMQRFLEHRGRHFDQQMLSERPHWQQDRFSAVHYAVPLL